MDPSAQRQGCRFPDWLPARYVFAVLGSVGMAIVYGLKVNLSVCIVAMVNNTALQLMHPAGHTDELQQTTNLTSPGEQSSSCFYPEDQAAGAQGGGFDDGPFAWSERVQGLVLGSYFWGYLVTQMPGGRVAEMFSARWVFWGAVILNALCTVLTPPAARLGYGALIAARVLEGLGAGVTFPAMHVMIAKWTPPVERSRMSSIIYAGTALGTVISLPSSGIVAGSLGWEAVFYGMGGLSLIWCLLWPLLVYDSPESHPLISPTEQDLIVSSLGGAKSGSPTKHHKAAPVPWGAVLTSGPFLAIVVAHMCSNFGWYMLLIELPSYMKQVLRFDIQQNAGLSALPFLTMWFFSLVLSNRLDWARSRDLLSTTAVRKLATAIASVVPGLCLIGVCLAGCDRTWAVALMTLGITAIAGMFSGFLSNHIDIAPNYAGTLMAIGNTMATIPGFVVPVFVGELTHGNQGLDQWRIIFLTTVVLYGVEVIIYCLLASGEVQPWNIGVPEKGTPEECELALQVPNTEQASPIQEKQ